MRLCFQVIHLRCRTLAVSNGQPVTTATETHLSTCEGRDQAENGFKRNKFHSQLCIKVNLWRESESASSRKTNHFDSVFKKKPL